MKKLLKSMAVTACLFSTFSYADDVLNISYVRSPFNLQMMVMKEHNLLEKHLAEQNVQVNWHEITSGAQQAQALASGDLHIAGVMNTASVLMANGVNNPVRIIAGVSRPTDTFAIVAAKDGVDSIAALKGKTIAGPKGTVLHQTLVAALVKENMSINDVNFMQMGIAQAHTALQSGQVDAALLAASSVITAQKEGAKVLTTATGLVVPKLVMASSETVIASHPAWIEAAVAAHDEASEWIANNHDEAIALGASLQGISIDDAQKLYDWAFFTQRFNKQDKMSMNEDMQFMLENDMMRRAVDIDSIFYSTSME